MLYSLFFLIASVVSISQLLLSVQLRKKFTTLLDQTSNFLHAKFFMDLVGHKDSVSSLAFSSDGQLLASGSLEGLTQIWDISSGSLKCTLEGPQGGIEVRCEAIVSYFLTLYFFEIYEDVTFQWVRWHPRGHVVLVGSEDSTVWMWNADRGVYLQMFTGHAGSVTCGDFTPDGMRLFIFHLKMYFK